MINVVVMDIELVWIGGVEVRKTTDEYTTNGF
jgi:hypothetical protein